MKSSKNNSLVLVTGVFDILHIEHLRFLIAAKKLGHQLIVGIETDERVKKIKGANRPINSQQIRLEQLSALKPVDKVILLPSSFDTYQLWYAFMSKLSPDFYAVSSHTKHLDIKQQICDQLGIKLVIVSQHNPNISTSGLLDKITRQE